MGLGSRADIATLGLAISLVTSASVSFSNCFLVFFFIRHDATRANRIQFNSDHVWPLGFLFVKLKDWWETVPFHENWCGLKTAHLWNGDAGRATGSFPTSFSSSSDVPSREVKEAFNKHQCEKYPRKPD